MSLFFGCPKCGSESASHMAAKIGTRRLSNGDLERFIECNVCTNCNHEWPLEDLSDVIAALSSRADAKIESQSEGEG